jgi:hypothetical protein
MYPTCIFVQYDSKYDRKLSTKWPNQGLLIDKTVDSGLSSFCQIRHPFTCSDSPSILLPEPTYIFWWTHEVDNLNISGFGVEELPEAFGEL